MKLMISLCGLLAIVVAAQARKRAVCEDCGVSWPTCKCNAALCILAEKWCDGRVDCPDGRDEEDCPPQSCFSAGTTIILAGGHEMAVEKQRAGLKVISAAGEVASITGEYVENDMGAGGQLFGINDDGPFATINHPFWTTNGWKSLKPETAMEENPDINYGVLQIGDTVFRIVQTDPVLYKPIMISQLSFSTLSGPLKTYGLHLDGPQSYHANGYLVAANYPTITKKRVQDGMKKLSEGEKYNLMSTISSDQKLVKVLGGWTKGAFVDAGLSVHKPIGDI